MFLNKHKGRFQTRGHAPYDRHQHGFVLILALVMLTVLTLIGVSSMNSASIELKAAANAQQHIVAFNGTQSVLEFTMSPPAGIDWTRRDIVQQTAHALPGTANLNANVVFVGCSVGIGGSLQAGRGLNFNFFNVAGNGANATNTSTSIQNQGVRFPAALC